MQNKTFAKKERDSNFELLRIIAMFAIVISHLTQHGIWFSPDAPITNQFLIAHLFEIWSGQMGNWLFVLISGYFVCTAQFSWKKVFALWLQIFSISAAIGIIAYVSKIPVIGFQNPDYTRLGFFAAAKSATKMDLLRCLLPCYFGNNWFAVSYIVFYLFVPFLNEFRKNLSRQMHLRLLALMLALGCVVKNLPLQSFFVQDNLFMFILGYFIASYIRFYNPRIFSHAKINAAVAIFLLIFFALWNCFVYKFLYSLPFVRTNRVHVLGFFGGGMPRVLSTLCATLIFCVFRSLKIPHNRFINSVASTTFGVYLLHENLLINKTIWHAIFRLDDWVFSPLLLPYMFLCALLTFAVCSLIETGRSAVESCCRKMLRA